MDPALPAAVGEARAGTVGVGAAGEAALFGGVTAEGRTGDIKLYNHRIQLVIQGPYEGNGYIDSGGGMIDLDLVRDDGVLGRDLVEDLFPSFDLSRLAHASSIVIVADGSEGGAAVVQTRGTDVPWVVTTLTNTGDETVAFTPQEGTLASGEDLLSWSPGVGFAGTTSGAIDQRHRSHERGGGARGTRSPRRRPGPGRVLRDDRCRRGLGRRSAGRSVGCHR